MREDAHTVLTKLVQGSHRCFATQGIGIQTEREKLSGTPYAAVWCCSDQRPDPEVLFDAPEGGLFVVQTSPTWPSMAVSASIDYAASQLKIPLLVVLGHHGCKLSNRDSYFRSDNGNSERPKGGFDRAFVEEAVRTFRFEGEFHGPLEIVGAYLRANGQVEFFGNDQ